MTNNHKPPLPDVPILITDPATGLVNVDMVHEIKRVMRANNRVSGFGIDPLEVSAKIAAAAKRQTQDALNLLR